ncbi:MAG: endonuclease/exonuclease/phosphatase family protein, partial [Planctomycetota bacterium]
IKPLKKLVNMYYGSVGRNSTLIVGLTPDKRGLMPDADVNRCREFGQAIKKNFSNEIARTSGKGNILELTLPANASFDHLVLQEDIKQGERVRQFEVESFSDGEWTELNTGSCIGHKRIVKLKKPVVADRVRLTISESIADPIIKTFAVYDSLNPKTKEKQLKVLSFNILQAGGNAANVGFENKDFGGSRVDEIAEVITSSGAKIVGLQETHYTGNIDEKLLSALGDGWTLQGTILSKYKLTPIETGDWFTICRAHLDSGKSIIVINTHWWPKGGGLDKIQKMLSAGQAPKPLNKDQIAKKDLQKFQDLKKEELDRFEQEILNSLSSDKGPRGYLRTVNAARKYIDAGESVVITGDFNEPSHLDWTDFYALRGKDRLVRNSTDTPMNFRIEWKGSKLLTEVGLKDAYRLVHDDEVAKPGITWTPPYPNGTPGRRDYDDQILTRIDMIYFSGDELTAVDAAVIGEDKRFAEVVYPRKWPSDHRAVLATFAIDSPEQETKQPVPFADRLEYVGIAVRDKGWDIWGSSPILGDDGKTHIFAARWPTEVPFNRGWRHDSQIAHYVADSPEGPFEFSDIALKGTGEDTWDRYGPHNPLIKKIDGKYVLLHIANAMGADKGNAAHTRSQRIGMAISDLLHGPWKKAGKDGLILSPSDDPKHWTYRAGNGVNNPAFLHHPDGRFFLYYKSNKARMGLTIADKLEGPYIHQPNPVTDNKTTIEDGYAFMMDDDICLLTTDNHDIIKRGGGLLWRSKDGITFDPEPTAGFGRMRDHIPAEYWTKPKKYYSVGGKF